MPITNLTHLTVLGSWLGADVINSGVLTGSDEWAQYWQSSCDHPETFFADYGWTATAIQPGEPGACYGRFTYQFADRSVTDAPHLFFITASR